jgi:hypothetical protein
MLHTNRGQAVHKTDRKSLQLRLVAIAEDEATREFIAIIKFRDINGQIRRLEQPKSSLRKIDQLKEALDNAGAYLSTNDKENTDAIRARPIIPSGGNMPRLSDGMMGIGHSSCLIALLADLAAMLVFSHRVARPGLSSLVRAAIRIG